MKDAFLNSIDNVAWLSKCLRFLKIRDSRELHTNYRTVYANNQRPDDYNDLDEPLDYVTNQITTSKYTLLNFLPKNLFEQFRRIANFYFLINAILTFIIPDPPSSPYLNIIPIIFVLTVTAVKQAYEDILRHIADKEINNLPIRILRDQVFQDLKWKNIICGDIVEVLADQPFPCDLLLIYSKSEDNNCFITTANLDGESNLKTRTVPNGIPEFRSENELSNIRCVLKFDKPNASLYEFNGKFSIRNREFPIVNDNVLLRGCTLRVAPRVYGIALYTGKDTKMMRNSKFKANKLSCIERKLNQFIIVFLIVLALLTILTFGLSFINRDIYTKNWYLNNLEPNYFYSNTNLYNFLLLMYYMNLYNYIIPLPLYVTIEIQRFVGSQFLEWDLGMYDPKTNQPAKANTSDLNEDLGQIEYLFSDKTGTLTENEMEFKQFSIDGIIYEEKNGNLYQVNTNNPINFMNNARIMNLLEILSFCHTVQIDQTSSKERFQASSPDELSFIKFCMKLGIIYEGDEKQPNSKSSIRTVRFRNILRRYEILDILEFDSTRKRMSILLRNLQSNSIIMFCKGAETFIIKKCISGNFNQCLSDIENFGRQGWRTLALSMKTMNENEYRMAKQNLNNAYNDIMQRNNRIAEAFEKIESGLTLIGATAIEDKLQEDVADTLETIRRAGIKIWVLTGDKKETAINISHSCKHFSDDMTKLIITDMKDPSQISTTLIQFKQLIDSNQNETNSYALIIDGSTLGHLFEHDFDDEFREICMKCDAVLCCRMSPAQKAEVVKLVKKSKLKPMTCAVGDGANDVSMIQEAHVGLGIFGKEGRNAARSADFAFAKFKFVKRILLIHGYLYYTRAAYLVQYFFYKDLIFVISQFYYSFINAFSANSLYDALVLTFYNIFLTSAPIILFGLFEQKVSIEELEDNPYLYRTIRKNKILRSFEFFKWSSLAIWHSLVAFFFAYGMFSAGSFSNDAKVGGTAQLGALVITTKIVIVHTKLFCEWHYQTFFLLIGYFLSILGYVVCCLIPNSFIVPSFLTSLTDNQTLFWVYYNLLSNISIWLCFLLSVVAALIPDLVIIAFDNLRNDRKIEKIKMIEFERIYRSSSTVYM